MNYEDKAKIIYADDYRLKKAVAAGKLIDNRLKKEYSKNGETNCHFDMTNYLKYFYNK